MKIKQQVTLEKKHKLSKNQIVNPPRSKIRLPSVNNPKIAFEGYMLGKILGQGAFGKVRKAIRKSDELQCVIKTYDKYRVNTQSRRLAIKKQVKILSQAKHEIIISFVQYFETEQTMNIVMQYFSNKSLTTFIKQNGPLLQETIREVTIKLVEGIQYLHQMGFAHRDLKPDNILIRDDGPNGVKVKIIDFGLGLIGTQQQIKIAGTPQFMPPELSKKQYKYDPYKGDIWSLGMMMYYLACGYFPPKKKTLIFPVSIHPGMEYLISKMLKQDPQDRISAEQILQDTWLKPKNLKAEILKLSKMKKNETKDK